MRQLACFAFATLAITPYPATAQVPSPASELVMAFVGICVQTMPRFDTVEAMARSQNWRSVTRDQMAAAGPTDLSADAKGWAVRTNSSLVYLVGINSGVFEGRQAATCSIASGSIQSADVEKELNRVLELKRPAQEDSSGGQRFRIWKIVVGGEDRYVTFTDAPRMDTKIVSLGLMAKR